MTSSGEAWGCLLGWKKSGQALSLRSVGKTDPLGASVIGTISFLEGDELRFKFSGGNEKTLMISSAVVAEKVQHRDKNSFSTAIALDTTEWGVIILMEV